MFQCQDCPFSTNDPAVRHAHENIIRPGSHAPRGWFGDGREHTMRTMRNIFCGHCERQFDTSAAAADHVQRFHLDRGPAAPTYRDIIRAYADTVDAGGDADLSAGQRRLLARLLRAVASPPIITDAESIALSMAYPPSPDARAVAVATLHYYLTRTYATAADYGLDWRGWDATVTRAIECLRNV